MMNERRQTLITLCFFSFSFCFFLLLLFFVFVFLCLIQNLDIIIITTDYRNAKARGLYGEGQVV